MYYEECFTGVYMCEIVEINFLSHYVCIVFWLTGLSQKKKKIMEKFKKKKKTKEIPQVKHIREAFQM